MDQFNSQEWTFVKEVIGDALERPVEEREAYAGERCREHPGALERVLDLLALADDASPLANGRDAAVGSLANTRLGNYQLRWKLGHGGFGEVYVASRCDQVQRRVAVKVLRPDSNDEEFRLRFRREMRVLGALNHPHIVSLFDAGETPEGRMYFVMEHVEGSPITSYCREHSSSLEDRLKLFLDLCDAVQYAHNHCVVHRDLKPRNILVRSDGELKLLDFGVAKLLNPAMTGDPEPLTRPQHEPVTIGYSSPEQLTGGNLTTATDVYSLGVILYELLAGKPPFPYQGQSAAQYERVVTEQAPAAPSREAAAGWRDRVRGDLDHIALKALRKEPDRRYRTAEHLAEDIRRYLRGFPVEARPDGVVYRCGKFVRRHRAAVAAAVAAFLALAAAAVVNLRLRQIAERERSIADAQRARAERLFRDLRDTMKSFPVTIGDINNGAGEEISRILADLGDKLALSNAELASESYEKAKQYALRAECKLCVQLIDRRIHDLGVVGRAVPGRLVHAETRLCAVAAAYDRMAAALSLAGDTPEAQQARERALRARAEAGGCRQP